MHQRRVLIVDAVDDTRQMLKLILQRRGWTTSEATASEQGLQLVDDLHPDVIILDAETLANESDAHGACTEHAWHAESTPVLFLGEAPNRTRAGAHRQLDKPYHYAPLLRTIEELWGHAQQRSAGDEG